MSEVGDDDVKEIAFLHHQLGYIARQEEDLDQAPQHYQQVLRLDLTRMSNNDRRLVSVYSNIALVFHHKGELHQALEQYQRALTIEEHADEPSQEQLVCTLVRFVRSNLRCSFRLLYCRTSVRFNKSKVK